MEIFRPKFPCTNENLALQIMQVSAGFKLETFGLAPINSYHLTTVSVKELTNFYLTAQEMANFLGKFTKPALFSWEILTSGNITMASM
jgi:hypothetical protein